MKRIERSFGGVECAIFEQDDPAAGIRGLAIFFHGYCAKGASLASKLFESCGLSLGRGWAAVFPQGPVPIVNDKWSKPGDSAWWSYETARLEAFESGARSLLEEDEEHPGIEAAAAKAKGLLADIRREAYPEASVLVLGGFSQGAVLATELALDPDLRVPALGIFSGTLTSRGRWVDRMREKSPGMLKVIQSHGASDPIFGIEAARNLRRAFDGEGHPVRYFEADAGHALHKAAVQEFGMSMLGSG